MTKAYAFAGTTMTVLVSGAETGGAFAALHVIKPSGSSTPPHSHDREFELSYVLSGTLSADIDGRIETRGPNGLVVLPPMRPHRLFNDSGETVREFLLCAPAMFDRFVEAAGSPVAPYAEPRPMTGEDRQRLIDAAPGFGVRLLRGIEPVVPMDGPLPRQPITLESQDSRFEVLAQLGPTAEDLVLMRVLVEPGRDLFLSGNVDQGCIFVVEGALEIKCAAEGWRTLRSGDVLHVRPETPCDVRTLDDGPARFLLVSSVRAARQVLQSGRHDRG